MWLVVFDKLSQLDGFYFGLFRLRLLVNFVVVLNIVFVSLDYSGVLCRQEHLADNFLALFLFLFSFLLTDCVLLLILQLFKLLFFLFLSAFLLFLDRDLLSQFFVSLYGSIDELSELFVFGFFSGLHVRFCPV